MRAAALALLLLTACTPHTDCLDGPERYEEACDGFWTERVDPDVIDDD